MKKKIGAVLRKTELLYARVRCPRFYAIKQKAKGMLSPFIYKRMYDRVGRLPDLDIVEVGGAAGAGSVAIASALKDGGKHSKLIVVEKCEGGSRSELGEYSDNVAFLMENFVHFGVQDHIILYPHELTVENGSEVCALIKTGQIAALIHDADGRLDRDFLLFWPLVAPGGLIIVDDYANRRRYKPISERNPQGGIKFMLTYRLLNQFMEWGLFTPEYKKGTTIFGRKPADADFARFDPKVCTRIIKEIQQEHAQYLEQQVEQQRILV